METESTFLIGGHFSGRLMEISKDSPPNHIVMMAPKPPLFLTSGAFFPTIDFSDKDLLMYTRARLCDDKGRVVAIAYALDSLTESQVISGFEDLYSLYPSMYRPTIHEVSKLA